MSTRLTDRGIPMVESHSLKLVFGTTALNEAISGYLVRSLQNLGYRGASASVLGFLSALECGTNYGSEIARSLGISRQMVAKTVKELARLGYLEQLEGQGRKKPILFTERGERLMSDARRLLALLDERLGQALGPDIVKTVVNTLENLKALVPQADSKPSQSNLKD